MGIHQIQIQYNDQEDRLLMRISTTDGCEYRFWLTRRYVKRLWAMLLKMLEWDRAVQQQVDAGARRTVMEIQHEGFAQQGNYSKPFEDSQRRLPLGEAPVLLAQANGKKQGEGAQVIGLHPLQGQGIDLTLDTRLLHIFSKLLQDAVARAEWDLQLGLHEGESPPAQVPDTRPRKLN